MSNNMEIRFGETVRLDLGNTIPVPVRDYLLMVHKPQINGHELVGDLIIKLGNLENDVGYLTEETDPTVAAWAKQPTKPSYTPEEIGAMPSTVVIPVRVSQLENDAGYYVKPVNGIPLSDIEQGVVPTKLSQLANDAGFYVKPNGGIPASDLEAMVLNEIRGKMDASMKGAPNGVAELDQNGMIRSYQLPSYVDDVKAYTSMSYFPPVGEDDKIYVDKSTNQTYRWGGPDVGYIAIGTSLALGETANSAYRGDRGKIAYDHAMAKGSAYTSGLYKITTNAEGHIVSAIPVVKTDITDLGIPGSMPDVSGFYTKPVNGIPASDLADGVIPTVPVTDIQIDGTSILQNGIANIPTAGSSTFGVIKVSTGLNSSNGVVSVRPAYEVDVKGGSSATKVLFPNTIDAAAFYGLAKAANASMSSSNNPVGTYTDAAKQAIQKMLGLDGILGDYESATASKAYAIGETFVYNGKRYHATSAIAINDVIAPGTNCVLDPLDGNYVRDTDYATTSKAGLVTCSPTYSYGINIVNDAGASGDVRIRAANSDGIKSGTQNYQPIVPNKQHESVFYGFAKAAGVDLANEAVTVGTYPETAKEAIQSMLGVPVASDADAREIITQYPKTWEVSA